VAPSFLILLKRELPTSRVTITGLHVHEINVRFSSIFIYLEEMYQFDFGSSPTDRSCMIPEDQFPESISLALFSFLNMLLIAVEELKRN
jgi:ABC-type microcin C transport system permease subunit YejB